MPKFIDTLRRNSKEVQALEGAHATEFLKLLKGLEVEINGRLGSAYAGDKPLRADMLGRVLRETKAGIAVLEDKAAGLYTGMSEDAVKLSVEHTVEEIQRLSSLAGAAEGEGVAVSISAAKALADPAQALLANHFDTSVERYGLDVLNGVRRRLFIGLRAGDPYDAVVKDVSRLSQASKAQAERLVRTETSAAYGAARQGSISQAAKKAPALRDLKKMWHHTGSYDCDICGPLNGTERELNGTWTFKHGKHLRTVAHPPAHPNCTCTLVTMKPKWKSALEKLGYL